MDNKDNEIVQSILKSNNVPDTPEDIEKFFKYQGANNLYEFLTKHDALANFVYEKIKELY